MKSCLLLSAFWGILLFACNNEKKPATLVQPRDTTITIANSYTELFFDSTAMEAFISKEAMADSLADQIRSFYNSRNYQFAWFDSTGLTEYVHSFLNLQSQYISYAKDSSVYNPFLQQLRDSVTADSSMYTVTNDKRLKTELALTEGFFRYVSKAYQGNSAISAKNLGWFIPRKKINLVSYLDSIISHNGKNLSNYEPVNRQYNLLKEYLLKYYELQKRGGWDSIITNKKSFKEGDESPVIKKIKYRLKYTGDLTDDDTSSVFTPGLKEAVKNYQRRFGLTDDGIIGKSLLASFNEPVEKRIQKILINMERIRWVPADPPQDYLLVNIPAYKLYVYEKGDLAWSMNVVVGAVAHNTVIFTGDMKYVVFSPYWNVPPDILKKEVLPGIKKDKNYLASHDMEWNDGAVRQKPGPKNSLGLVKFLFPNSYNIYLHDTPAKSLFGETNRAFSHGCIRLSEPKKLAEYLLRNEAGWTTDKITKAMNSGKEQFVTLKQPMPVFIGYFTSWVDRDGKLNFRDDIYGHDKKMAAQLFGVAKK
ncbi:MAG: L,D-transpeptidase family protein [Bacteroidetes bacterium]|nr:L,D-transpeptidase family protein [Bacteroidota bacterium]